MADRASELLRFSPFAAREALRGRFTVLPARAMPRTGVYPDRPTADDVDVLRLLRDTVELANSEPSKAEDAYAGAHQTSGGRLPDFTEAQARGWFRNIDGDFTRAVSLWDYLHHAKPDYADDLMGYCRSLWQVSYEIQNPGTYGTAAPLEAFLNNGASGNRPNIRSPAWVAARLWDAEPNPDFVQWKMRWEALDFPQIVPEGLWSADHAQLFRDAVLKALRGANLPGWADANAPEGLLQSGDARKASPIDLGAGLLGRYLFLSRTHNEHRLFNAERLLGLTRQLVLELPQLAGGKVAMGVAQSLVALAMDHPDVVVALVDCHDLAPNLLVDLILCPHAAGLVCYLVAIWSLRQPAARDRPDALVEPVTAALFEDCLDVFSHHLTAGMVVADEYTELLIALQERDAARPEHLPFVPMALGQLKRLSAELQSQVLRGLVNTGASDANSPAFQVLLKALAAGGPTLSDSDAAKTVEVYRAQIATLEPTGSLLLDVASAGALARIAFAHATLRDSVLRPLDVRASLAEATSDTVKLGLSLRTHIRFLCRAVLGYQETVPKELAKALSEAIDAGACADADGKVDAFTFQLDFLKQGRLLRLEVELADAICRFELPSDQTLIVDALLAVRDPLVFAVLLRRAPPMHRDKIRARLAALGPSDASPPTTSRQRQERVQAFLDAGLPEVAELYLKDLQLKEAAPNGADAALRDLYFEMNLCYQRGQYEKILRAELTKDFPEKGRIEGQRTLSFFLALTLLSDAHGDPVRAAKILSRLYKETKDPLYAMNCLAARIANLLAGNLYRTLSGDPASQARAAIDEADEAVPPLGPMSDIAKAVHVPNCALMLLAIGRPDEALRRLQALDPSTRTVEALAYEAVAQARLGERGRAKSLIDAGKAQFGDAKPLEDAASHITRSTPGQAAIRLVMQAETDEQILAAITKFLGMSAERQAKVLVGGMDPLAELVKETFRNGIAVFERSLSFLHLDSHSFLEDDYNGLLAEFVGGRFEGRLGWQAQEQSPGGFTAKGNAGRRDFVMRKDGVDIAVFEGLKSTQPNDPGLKRHFEKLLAYSKASLFVHVTYNFRTTPDARAEMLTAVERVANDPDGAVREDVVAFDAEGARPGGFIGFYRRDGDPVTVFFFVIDMLMAGMRKAVGAPQVATS